MENKMKKQIITTFVIIVISSLLIGQNSRMGSASSTQLLVVPSAKHLSGGEEKVLKIALVQETQVLKYY